MEKQIKKWRIWEILREKFVKLLKFVFNPRLLLCFGIGWMITNGWAYVLMGVGTYFHSTWMMAIAGFYLSLLWFPFTPEKIFTLAIAIWLLARLFPHDKNTLAVLREEHEKAKNAFRKQREKRKQKKQAKKHPSKDTNNC